MIISFSGVPGAGKSTIAKMLAQKLGWPRYYMGDLRRQKAKERGMTLEEYNKLGETDPSTDLEVDRYQEKLGKEKDDFIIEGRTSWYFIPHSLKIYLDVDLNKGSERIYWQLKDKNNKNKGEKLKTLEQAKETTIKRIESDNKRYNKYFGIDVYNKNNYNIVIDTTDLDIDQVFKKIWEKIDLK